MMTEARLLLLLAARLLLLLAARAILNFSERRRASLALRYTHDDGQDEGVQMRATAPVEIAIQALSHAIDDRLRPIEAPSRVTPRICSGSGQSRDMVPARSALRRFSRRRRARSACRSIATR